MTKGAMSLRVASSREIIAYSATVPGTPPSKHAADARLVARTLSLTPAGSQFGVDFDGELLGQVTISVPGVHNVRNALAAIASGLALGCTVPDMAPGLAAFRGVERRFQRLGSARDVEVVDDYAHHPTEVAATLAAARNAFPDRRIVLAFQPHLYSRTRDLQQEFADALSKADVLFLCDIYGRARSAGAGRHIGADRRPHGLGRVAVDGAEKRSRAGVEGRGEAGRCGAHDGSGRYHAYRSRTVVSPSRHDRRHSSVDALRVGSACVAQGRHQERAREGSAASGGPSVRAWLRVLVYCPRGRHCVGDSGIAVVGTTRAFSTRFLPRAQGRV
jgi:hypothetical protein